MLTAWPAPWAPAPCWPKAGRREKLPGPSWWRKLSSRPWLVTYRGWNGRILKRRFGSEAQAVLFIEVQLYDVHPVNKALAYTATRPPTVVK